MDRPLSTLRPSQIYRPEVMEDIHLKAELGRYRFRGFGTLRPRPLPSFDDLTFIPCSLTRIPLEGYRERCSTKTRLGTRHAKRPIELDTPVMITGMSWGALSYNAKVALAEGARRVGSSTTTGDGGMLPAEREHSRVLVYEVLPSRYGMSIHDLRAADGVELTVGQGAKPGTGGVLLGSKVSPEIAAHRELPPGVDQRSPARHPDWLGPDDMIIKIEELREATDWQVPIFVKLGATRVFDDVKLAAKAGADVVVVDGMEGGTAASPEILQDHTGIPRWPPSARRGAASRTSGSSARCSSSSPAASGRASMPPRRSPSAPTPSTSALRRSSRSTATSRFTSRTITPSGRSPTRAITATRDAARSASPPRTPS